MKSARFVTAKPNGFFCQPGGLQVVRAERSTHPSQVILPEAPKPGQHRDGGRQKMLLFTKMFYPLPDS